MAIGATPPVSIEAGVESSISITTPITPPTLQNSEIKFDDDLGPAAVINSITGSDPYTINFTFPVTTPKDTDIVGYPLYVEVDTENYTSAAIPFTSAPYTVLIDRSIDLSLWAPGSSGIVRGNDKAGDL